MQATPYTAAQYAGFAIATTGGRLMGVQVTLQGTTTGAAVSIYDHATAASGTVIWSMTGSGTAAQALGWNACGPTGVGIPFTNGLWCVPTQTTGGSGIVVYSTTTGPYDGRPVS